MKDIARRSILLTLSIMILAEWTVDVAYRFLHLQEKIHEHPALADLLRSSLLEGTVTFAVIGLSLAWLREGREFLQWKRASVGDIGRGVLIGGLVFLFSSFLLNPLLHVLFPAIDERVSPLRDLFADPAGLPIWIFLAIFGGGFIEELQRIFVLRVFESAFGRAGLWICAVVGSVVFGFGHLYQGIDSAISIGITGFLYALAFILTRRPLIAMIAHATFDLIGVGFGFWLFR